MPRCRVAFLILFWASLGLAQPVPLGLQLATYLGGQGSDNATDIAFDSFGDMWICGNLDGAEFPTPTGVTPSPLPGGGDIFVVHIDVTEDNEGNRTYALLQALIIGGSDADSCAAIVITPEDRIFIGGRTRSPDFPLLQGPTAGDFDLFVAELGSPLATAQVEQTPAQVGPREIVNAVSYGGPAEDLLCDLALWQREQDFALFVGAETLGDMPLGGGLAHRQEGVRDIVILRIDDQLNLEQGIGIGGEDQDRFSDMSVRAGEALFTAFTFSSGIAGVERPTEISGGLRRSLRSIVIATVAGRVSSRRPRVSSSGAE